MDGAGRLFVAHASLGHVFVFAPNGELIARIKSCAGPTCTNVAIGGAEPRPALHHGVGDRHRCSLRISVICNVIARSVATKQSIFVWSDGLLRFARNDGNLGTRGSIETATIRPQRPTRRRDRAGHLVYRSRRSQDRGRRLAPRHRARHDPYRHRRDVWRRRARGRGRHRRAARRDFSGLEGVAEQRLAARHHHRLRALAEAAEDRPARLLSAALARLLSAFGNRRRVRGAGRAPARSAPGASAISMSTISTKCWRLRARARSPATRCSII